MRVLLRWYDFPLCNSYSRRKGNLPEKIEKIFSPKTELTISIYLVGILKGNAPFIKRKAYVCSAYKCELLNSFREKKMPLKECLKIVKQGRKMRKEVVYYFQKYTGKKKNQLQKNSPGDWKYS